MSLKIYNVLSRKKEEFVSQEPGKVKMYACGITASGDAHIGHAFQAIVFDTIKKYLEYIGYEVTYVRNYTDVDDKIIIRARQLGVSPMDYANKMMAKIDKELEQLFISKPTIQSKATECIQDMIKSVDKLIKDDHAYSTENGDVFFKVSSFKNYGAFSNRCGEDALSGVRKEVEPGKLDDKDFALWKNAKNDEIYWDSPWGIGRPGWHIECSVMSMKYLGETLDIHGGGKDLIFPHHENEIAQSESLTGKQFSRYWIHNGLIKVNGQKMSKSLNNGILVEDLLKEYNPEVIRMTLLENNYRSDVNVIDGVFEQHDKKIYNIYKAFDSVDSVSNGYTPNPNSETHKNIDKQFREAMDNDFNTSLAIANLFDYINIINKNLTNKGERQNLVDLKDALINTYKVLGLLQQDPKTVIAGIKDKYMHINNIKEDEVMSLIKQREMFKQEKNYEEADKIRNILLEKGVAIKDMRGFTDWEVIL